MFKLEFAELHHKAHKAGLAAGEAASPTPMIVSEHANSLDDNSPVTHTYAPINEGVCGFAWLVVPGTSGFGRWAKLQGLGRSSSYEPGVKIWVREFGQSYERKGAYASAYVKVLREAGLVKAYAEGRLD